MKKTAEKSMNTTGRKITANFPKNILMPNTEFEKKRKKKNNRITE